MERIFEVGQSIVYHDRYGRPMPALLTAIHGSVSTWKDGTTHYPCVNVVFCSLEGDKTDPYGRQIERETSVVHKQEQSAGGFYWRWPDEEPNPQVEAKK